MILGYLIVVIICIIVSSAIVSKGATTAYEEAGGASLGAEKAFEERLVRELDGPVRGSSYFFVLELNLILVW